MRKKHFFMHYLQCCTTKAILKAVKMPEKGKKAMFKDHQRQLYVHRYRLLYMPSLNLHCITENINGCTSNNSNCYIARISLSKMSTVID